MRSRRFTRRMRRRMTRDERVFFQDLKICPYCHVERLFGSEKSCPECRAKQAEERAIHRENNRERYNVKMRTYHKALYENRIAQGICPRCGKRKVEEGFRRCARCRAVDGEKRRIKGLDIVKGGENRVKNGQCYWCGEPVKAGYKVCEKHYQMNVDKARLQAKVRQEMRESV